MRNTTKILAFIAMVIAVYSCQSYTHVVTFSDTLMNVKTGKIERAKLDSTFKMYDKILIKDGTISKVKSRN